MVSRYLGFSKQCATHLDTRALVTSEESGIWEILFVWELPDICLLLRMLVSVVLTWKWEFVLYKVLNL